MFGHIVYPTFSIFKCAKKRFANIQHEWTDADWCLFFGTGIILTILLVILFLIVLVLRKRIQIAIQMIKEASK